MRARSRSTKAISGSGFGNSHCAGFEVHVYVARIRAAIIVDVASHGLYVGHQIVNQYVILRMSRSVVFQPMQFQAEVIHHTDLACEI